jgi:hypothetical protein
LTRNTFSPSSREKWANGGQGNIIWEEALEHRHFERHGESGERLRTTVEKPEGWSYVLGNFAKAVSDSSYPR